MILFSISFCLNTELAPNVMQPSVTPTPPARIQHWPDLAHLFRTGTACCNEGINTPSRTYPGKHFVPDFVEQRRSEVLSKRGLTIERTSLVGSLNKVSRRENR